MKKMAIAMLFAGSTLLMADGAAIFTKCAACHGQKAEKAALGKSAVIQGMDEAKLEELIKGYKAGTLNQHGMGALMHGQVKDLSDDDIKAVATYISGLK